ncbi:ABC-type transport auxiliary lipoprotein family protein [Arcobacter sp. CECT 8985]|uniref:ABC-type transport auxiliary lipoprotein family protein n=1 Tax=Arcobacter sp. CECT 8985 TaxID=1935424 RepID=UPI00100B195D|nr:ABC-type transport auxiliary lipoprotein family protein [Arcobacter sp. CECT 8985]RXJ83739.1 hypothetical protein CRU93_13455 [Arcobacter sp. CECT 8985]
MKNLILMLLIALSFNACSFKQTTYTLNKYTIKYKSQNEYKTINNSIIIKKPTINPIFNTKDMLYSTKEYKLQAYLKNCWSDLPSSIIHQEIMNAFDKNNLFKTTLIYPNKSKATYQLDTHIYKIYNKVENNNTYAILNIKFELYRKNKLIDTFKYNRLSKNSSNKPYSFVVNENIIFNEIIDDLSSKIENSIKN